MKKQEIKKMAWREKAALLIFSFTPGMLVGLFLWVGELLGKVKVLHRERLKLVDLCRTLFTANHPSWGDPPFAYYATLFKVCVKNPIKYAPLIVADRKQFFDRLKLFRPVMIPVDRGDPKKEALSFRRILECFRQNERPGILFVEGGRTSSGSEEEMMYSPSGEKIRRPKEGIGLLVKQLKGRIIVPIAIKGTEHVCPADPKEKHRLFTKFVFKKSVTINIGEPIIFDANLTRGEIAFKVGSKILALLDEIRQIRT
ncbi:MAG: lysophospholipid acyltransferase family protein [Candidatus Staskawiczbacteria bacterium]|jgi:1-acyl-sn-glycerol-3-phosphate acyltransferase